jgi:hypothetical protein
MNNFEKIRSLSLEEMASLNVKAFIYNSGYNVLILRILKYDKKIKSILS